MLTYKKALSYIYSFTNYEEKISYRYAPQFFDLARMERLLALLDNPHRRFRSLHIAGTKGKGSTAAMSESILRAAGYRTGLYTSPHLHTIRERIQVEGRLIPEGMMVSLVEHSQPLASQIEELTTFEIITALALTYFAQQGVELAILEVGLGGRLDATNVITPLVSVITSLSYDHTQVLGDTLAQIAREKAGIIKPDIPVVSAPQAPEALAVIEEVCSQKGGELTVVGQDWTWEVGEANLKGQSFRVMSDKLRGMSDKFWIPLLGRHQLINATVAIAAAEKLRERGVALPESSIREGLRGVRWPGRLEILSRKPFLVVDCAHNVDSARKLRGALKELFDGHRNLTLVFGASVDKDIEGMMHELIPSAKKVIVIQARHPRAADPHRLEEMASDLGYEVTRGEDVSAALDLALEMAGPQDLICATGSTFVVAEAREAWFERTGGMLERDPRLA